MKWVIKGKVELGYPYRCGSDGLQGHIWIGGKDFLTEFDEQDFSQTISVSINKKEVFRGKYSHGFGAEYSSYTPIDEDRLEINGKNILEHLATFEEKEVIVVIKDIK